MAETFLFTIAETVLGKLVDLSIEQVSLVFNVKTDFTKLQGTMSSIQAVLLDAERQQHHNEKLRLCMWKLRDIFYDAEDVFHDFRCEVLRKQVVNHPNLSLKVRLLSSCSFPLLFSLQMARKIKDINRRLDELATEWNSFNLAHYSDNRSVFHRETHSFVKSSDVFGRDEDKENIIDLLKRPSEDGGITVVPIVGFGGLGKTTLAQLIYNDVRVSALFPLKIWICVSDEFDLRRLLKLIIQSINEGEIRNDSTLDDLQIRLRRLLNNKKFLLVLDDVWNENQTAWVELRDLLGSMGGLSESKIIVTTRSLKVASIVSSIRPYELKGLPHEDCLTLFKKWAFDDGDGRRHPNLMRIGEEIVRKCKGVPLAVRTLGSLLFLKTDESGWVSIRDNELCTLEQGEDDILPVLKLSYNHLPPHLQRCLAFLSLYKKDETYRSDQVVRLWMANGLVEHSKQNQEGEDVGSRYLNELLSRCLIQKEEDDDFYFTFKMHDLIHDLALDVSKKECKIVDSQTETEMVDESVRHLSFYGVDEVKVVQVLKRLKNVRTIIIQQASWVSVESLVNLCASKFKYLRALKLPKRWMGLPKSIGNMKHLRDLHLTCLFIEKLPSSFHKLRSLQSLSIVRLKQLPDSVQGLIELRYLRISMEGKHFRGIGPGCWTCLQSLEFSWCDELECLPEGMQYLKSLRKLVLFRCVKLVSLPRSLRFLTKLEDLRIDWCPELNLEMEPEEEQDNDLRLNLKTFILEHSNALRDLPRLLLQASSSTFLKIELRGCPNFVELPTWLPDLTCLHQLHIINCPELSALPEGMDRLTRLEQLNIKRCPQLRERYQEGRGGDWHKIAHIPNVKFEEYLYGG